MQLSRTATAPTHYTNSKALVARPRMSGHGARSSLIARVKEIRSTEEFEAEVLQVRPSITY